MDHISSNTDELFPLVLVSLPISFLLSFAIGANDVANSFGTAYGSGVLTLKQCCILATIFETLGAVLLGFNVSETIRKGIFDVSCYDREENQLALGYFSALIGSGLWNLFATMLRLPVSGTHSILGSLLGFTLVAKSMAGIKWGSIAAVISSWFISPAASGIITILGYIFLYRHVLSVSPIKRSQIILSLLPAFFGLTFFVNIFSIVYKGPSFLSPFHKDSPLSLIFSLGVSVFVASVVWLLVQLVWVPKQRESIQSMVEGTSLTKVSPKEVKVTPTEASESIDPSSSSPTGTNNNNGSDLEGTVKSTEVSQAQDPDQDPPEVALIFRSLQILTSCFGSFAHGANDVSNAIGPLIALFLIFRQGNVYQEGAVPIYLLLFGGFGISVGLWVLGSRVIRTIGKDLTPVTPSTGFLIELCSSFTVLAASKLGFPISTTHCKVGSVVAVGWIRKKLTSTKVSPVEQSNPEKDDPKKGDEVGSSKDGDKEPGKKGVNWKLFGEIGAAWILTLPVSAGLTAFSFWAIRAAFPMFMGSDHCTSTSANPFSG